MCAASGGHALAAMAFGAASCLGCHHDIAAVPTTASAGPAAPVVVYHNDPKHPLQTEWLATPVRASRAWSTALAPNARGGWNFITQVFEFRSGSPSEFVVLDLETGKSTTFEGPTEIYTNNNYQIANEVRAKNGRIFFPELETNVAYYDPTDESVKQLGRMVDPVGANKSIYKLVFDHAGKLYGATLSTARPTVFELDPDTLAHRVIGEVGDDRLTYSYGYFLAIDSPWAYCAVGERPWELAALNLLTGRSQVLATRSDEPFMHLEHRKEGVRAKLVTGLKKRDERDDYVWCVDGKAIPTTETYDPGKLPFKSRDIQPYANPLVDPPEIDSSNLNPDADGIGHVAWRPHGSTGAWIDRTFKVKYTGPVELESLVALPDGSLFGNAAQYHGFFRYDPAHKATQFFGPHGPSRGPRIVVDGKVYIAGYPNGLLYEYDPTRPWTSSIRAEAKGATGLNPRKLGLFADAGAHYAHSLVASSNGRLYYSGRRERDGVGSGVGSYDLATNAFAGHHKDLSFYDPEGLIALDALKRVVFSGSLHDDPGLPGKTPPEAQLVVFDQDLREINRLEVKPGLSATGTLYPSNDGNTILGVIKDVDGKRGAVYRFDVAAGKLLDWRDLDAVAGTSTQRPEDKSVWIVVGKRLVRVDPTTLEVTTVGTLFDVAAEITRLVWQQGELYSTAGPELRRVALPR